ncbi:Outer spore wall protein RRT8 [Fulvia fulva]|uniref:Outer spore wall protein RRT8 n=1 Tax=Passalora fulva TaxID=5499 RepID=A0A9Q8PMF9_PASFU|nr:Outer spore wall protein RRT8 [Fulvia fulva]KAK4608934.1 Outer spore wall protein RRT8 [Fulvia fulva]KAK4610007.1 Outer spore wall protein RRT8 [Fulvia fulva]UJO25158.1 Outer spore wall protein RRT8 [Fulvia fulva]WPV22623.1 Outer spore wall protein RRT8 [Fulvia fulva]WPV37809.1 Outer spore wall protein RRT8 [Fulvia fulva]
MADNIKKTAKEEASRVQQIANEGVRSGAYIYPIKGIFYLLSHKELRKPLFSRLIPTMTLGAGITTLMFLFTYLPQLAVLIFTSGPIAALATILLVLSESSTLTMVLSKTLLIEDALIDTFDATLVQRGQTALVEKQRTVKGSGVGDAFQRLGKLATKPFAKFSPQAIIKYLMYLPLNFIPVVGTVIFVILQGRNYGPSSHARYFQLKGMNKSQQEKYIEARKAAYTAFGIPAVLLEMIPVAGIFAAFTNTCAAALWAADLESNQGTAQNLREEVEKASKGD